MRKVCNNVPSIFAQRLRTANEDWGPRTLPEGRLLSRESMTTRGLLRGIGHPILEHIKPKVHEVMGTWEAFELALRETASQVRSKVHRIKALSYQYQVQEMGKDRPCIKHTVSKLPQASAGDRLPRLQGYSRYMP